jgi:hypothetical protein
MRADANLTAGAGGIRSWVALLDRAETLMAEVRPHDASVQRQASKAIDSLFRFEHQLAPGARRKAREYVWRRDRPNEPLPQEALRAEWEQCRCPHCRYTRLDAARQSARQAKQHQVTPPPTRHTAGRVVTADRPAP